MTIGESAQSNANNSLALGNGTIINQEDIKNKNAKYTNDGFEIENGVVAIANKGKERRLVNLAAGREDTDAVNVKQLSEVMIILRNLSLDQITMVIPLMVMVDTPIKHLILISKIKPFIT